jgi:GGDEF domain-containing protein
VYLWCTLRSISATGSCTQTRFKCDESGAAARAENLRAAISTKPFQAHAKSLTLSISIGVALSIDFVNEDVDKIIEEAGRALYTAKAEGPNCVRVARPTSEPELPDLPKREPASMTT